MLRRNAIANLDNHSSSPSEFPDSSDILTSSGDSD
jgi:hypothetical protein